MSYHSQMSSVVHSSITHRKILKIAIPMTLAYMTTPFVGLVDTAVIGQLGDATLLGAIAIGTMIFDVLLTSLNVLRAGTTGLIAQGLGRGETHQQRSLILFRALFLGLICGLLLILFQKSILSGSKFFFEPGKEVFLAAQTYCLIRFLSAPIALMNFALLGYVIGLGKAGTSLIFQTILNGTNIGLSIIFVLFWGYGIEGVAWATVIAECMTFGVMLIWLVVHWPDTFWRKKQKAKEQGIKSDQPISYMSKPYLQALWDMKALKKLIVMNSDMMLRSFALLLTLAFFTRASSQQGEIILSANAILQRFFLIAGFFLDGLATAAEQLAGYSLGARKREDFERTIKLSFLWSLALASLCAFIFWLSGDLLIELITTAENVRDIAQNYLIWAVITPITGVLAFVMDGVFIGATWSKDIRNAMVISLIFFLTLYWALFPLLGNHGLWLAFNLFLVSRGTMLYLFKTRNMKEAFNNEK